MARTSDESTAVALLKGATKSASLSYPILLIPHGKACRSYLPYTSAPTSQSFNVTDLSTLWLRNLAKRAYPQQIVTTRLLYCLQDPFAQLSRLQRIRSRACLNCNPRAAEPRFQWSGRLAY